MNPEYKPYELIDRYLNQQLSGEELRNFENKIASEPDFAEKVETQRIANDALLLSELVVLKSKMKQDFDTRNFEPGKGNKGKYYLFGAAAVFLGAVLLWVNHSRVSDDQRNTLTKRIELKQDKKIIAANDNSDSPTNAVNNTIMVNQKRYNQPQEPKVSGNEVTGGVNEVESGRPVQAINEEVKNEVKPLEPVISKTEQRESLKPEKKELVINCEDFVVDFSKLKVKHSSYDTDNGSIELPSNAVRGAAKPLYYQLVDEREKGYSNYFEYLYPDSYLLKVSDSEGCNKSQNVTISRSNCISLYKETYSLSREERWDIPVVDGLSASVRILFNKNTVVYESDYDGYSNLSWDGKGINGSAASVGYYECLIEYEDGSVCNVKLSVLP